MNTFKNPIIFSSIILCLASCTNNELIDGKSLNTKQPNSINTTETTTNVALNSSSVNEDQYLVGDWNGDGTDNLAILRNNQVYKDINLDGTYDIVQNYGNGSNEDEYLVGDWNGDGKDNIAVRRNGNRILT